MKLNKQWHIRLRLWILLFSGSVSVTIFPSGIINTYGLFGEVTSSTVIEDRDSLISDERQVFKIAKNIKGINIINIWFEIWICISCLILSAYVYRLPRGVTIVTLKVRMDD